jgi:hypothetical protein
MEVSNVELGTAKPEAGEYSAEGATLLELRRQGRAG